MACEVTPEEVLLVVFFEGTANTLKPVTTQIGEFAHACSAVDIRNATGPVDYASNGPFKMAFDGCGVTNGLLGTLFASGLDAQCREVAKAALAILSSGNNTVPSLKSTSTSNQDATNDAAAAAPQPAAAAAVVGRRMKCVAVGLSRGGIACMKLTRALSATPDLLASIDYHALLFDPVPGNSLTTGFPFTACSSFDLRRCGNLRSVLALYPHQPLPAVALHAPVLPRYPQTCAVEEDVTLGCHQGALFYTAKRPTGEVERASTIAFHRIRGFLEKHGVSLRFTGVESLARYHPTAEDCLALCRLELERVHGATSRELHDGTGRSRTIVRAPVGPALFAKGGDGEVEESIIPRFLNRHHEELECEVGNGYINGHGRADKAKASYMLDILLPMGSK